MEHPLVDGTFEVHFMLKDSVSPPTLVELKQWQNRWRAIAVDPPPRPYETIFSFCASRGSVKKIDVTSLARPPKGDVETTLRHELGLLSVSDLVSSNLAAAMDVDMEHHRLTFHFATESCAERRGVEELDARDLEPGDAVKLHVERQL